MSDSIQHLGGAAGEAVPLQQVIDSVIAALLLALLWPVMLLAAVAIKLDSRGPVLFKQRRMGLQFRPFLIYKFRTMVAGAHKLGPGLTADQDPRVTRVGRFLRDTKLDELPQLFNVRKGEMSLVGSRPELPRYVRLFEEDYRQILMVRPGITDPASIAYRRESALLAGAADPEAKYLSDILPDKLRLAKLYVEHPSLAHNLRLLLETALVLAYPSRFLDQLLARLSRHRVAAAMAVQAALIALANVGALYIRYDGAPGADTRRLVLMGLPLLLLIRCAWLRLFDLHRDMWQYVGLSELGRIVASVALGSATFWLVAALSGAPGGYPPSIVFVDGMLCVAALSAVRIARRVHCQIRDQVLTTRSVLVVGVDDSAESVLRDLLGHPHYNYRIVGLVAQDRAATGLRLHSVPVVGTFDELDEILRSRNPDEIFIIASAIPAAARKDLVRKCRRSGRLVKLVPELSDILAGKQALSMEPPEPDDLLGREPIALDLERIRAGLRDRSILVTGAGGSIGSEICSQVAACSPKRLVLFEQHEASLFHVERRLREHHPDLQLDAVIGDIRDAARVEETFASKQPDIVFHAAAYKHVPMMERNPVEAIRTNVVGTKLVAEAADRWRASTFVLVSTDKAVEPVCIMGASKRMAELTVQSLAARSRTRFLCVRFGNVLGSSGSVVPVFQEQIEHGGPITVTDPGVTRWFMTIPEAVQLILEASALGKGGEVFVLDMGKQVPIVDLARSLIRQNGLRPEQDVPITITGLRPGERLVERLFTDHEHVCSTVNPKVLRATDELNGNGAAHRAEEFQRLMDRIQRAAGESLAAEWHKVVEGMDKVCA